MSPPWSRERDDADDRDPAGDDASGADPPSPPGVGAGAAWDDDLDDDDLSDDDLADEDALEALADLLLAEDLLFDETDEVDTPGSDLRTGSAAGWAPEARRAARHAHRPIHRRRTRHSFEPDDLTDVELDRLLRGPVGPVGLDDDAGRRADPRPPSRTLLTHDRSCPRWVMVVALGALILAALGLLRPVGDDTADTITTRDQSRPASGTLAPVPTPAPSPSSTATSGARPAVPPPADTGTAPETPPPTPTPAQGATELPPRTADATACHPSHDPCVPVDDDVDCAEGTEEVTGDDVSGLDADHDGQGCE